MGEGHIFMYFFFCGIYTKKSDNDRKFTLPQVVFELREIEEQKVPMSCSVVLVITIYVSYFTFTPTSSVLM